MMDTVYAGDDVCNSGARRDSIVYESNEQIHYGIIQVILCRNHGRNHKSDRKAIVRRLRECSPEQGNEKVVNLYGNRRFQYDIIESSMCLDWISVEDFRRRVVLVPDPWVLSRLYGAKMRFKRIPDDGFARNNLRFFEVMGDKHTCFGEQDLSGN
ncbi:hypothetical protein FGB62_294g010 [Gracilaria domingensis]|nr:hypothetical protein FGB62_294g07 [Gracilaria domingensis]KAI0557501.1 hypothetical protein FGB62_294g010 [Gracilaria domingensis]